MIKKAAPLSKISVRKLHWLKDFSPKDLFPRWLTCAFLFCAFLPGFVVTATAAATNVEMSVDVCVYGGTSGGVMAAVQAARMGKSVALICEINHLGGMTSSGLGWTDVGHVGTGYIQGLAGEFYTRINQKYGANVNYEFEPHVAEAVFNDLVQQAGVTVYTNQYLTAVTRQGSQIIAVTINNGNIFRAKMFIDASYTGDLMAAAGVSYTIGREATNQYGESLAGVQPPDTSFGANVSPYVVSNNPASGLLPLIQTNLLAPLGSADQLVQTYTFRMCFTQTSSNRMALTAPTNYNVAEYELLARYLQANPTLSLGSLVTLSTPLPNGKMDINDSGPFSTDFVGNSSTYPDASPVVRAQIWQDHKNYEQGFFYFLATDTRVPSSLRSAMQSWGPCRDEFTDNGGWPWVLYIREARRMVSDYVMTQSNVFSQVAVPDAIGEGGYFTDSHYCERIVTNGAAVNEGTARGNITVPYPIAYRALIPKAAECGNLLVPWCVSASHIAFCSLRMEPTFMIMGQAAGTAACLAINDGVTVQNVNVNKLQLQLLANQQALSTASTGSVIVDDTDATGVTIVGPWLSSTATSGYYGSDYLHDGNTDKGSESVTFTPNLPTAGTYQVYARWTANANRATNAPIDIIYPGGTNTILVNQTLQGGQWVWLMTTNFNAGTAGSVRIRNGGTTGYVIADAVEFMPGLPVVNVWATDAQASRSGPQSGSFTISSTGSTNLPLTINFNLGGTAVNGVDYQTVPGSVTLPPGVTSTNISIVPYTNSSYTNAQPVGNKTVVLSLASLATNSSYSLGNLAVSAVTINDTPINNWRLQYFGANAANPAIAGNTADPAGDGVPNLMKYALGLNPTQAISQPLYGYGLDTNGYFFFAYTRPDPPPADITYRVDASDDLMAWCTNGLCLSGSTIVLNPNNTATIMCTGVAPVQSTRKKFLRLSVSPK
jgi:hypothetical protein